MTYHLSLKHIVVNNIKVNIVAELDFYDMKGFVNISKLSGELVA